MAAAPVWARRSIARQTRDAQAHDGAADGIEDLFSLVKTVGIEGERIAYTRAGLGRFVEITYPQPDLRLSMLRPGGGSQGDAGDPYDGFDCPSPTANDLQNGFALNAAAIAARQCPSLRSRLPNHFAWRTPLSETSGSGTYKRREVHFDTNNKVSSIISAIHYD